jgi:molybdopterin molybdotransferase
VAGLLTVDEALALVLGRVQPLPTEEVLLRRAGGRVLARAAVAVVDLPPFRSSAMDGFAVRADDTPGTLVVVGQSAAGRPAGVRVSAGEAIAISTGAVVPDGADAVVPVESTSSEGKRVTARAVGKGDNIRLPGGDVRAGGEVAAAGIELGPIQLGALAAAGVSSVDCGRRPRVAVVPTGNELRPPGVPLEPGEIYESNGVLLEALARGAGADPSVVGPVPDDEDATHGALEDALAGNDVVITSGGVSVGPHDLVRAELGKLGVEEVFWRVAVKPGKPVAFGTVGATLVFGLPGNPVSSLVGFELFVRPALRALQGAQEPGPVYRSGRLARPLARDPDRDQFVRARVRVAGDGAVLEPLAGQESHQIGRAAAASALVAVPRGNGELPAGAAARFLAV